MKSNNVITNDVLAYRMSSQYDIPFNEAMTNLQAILDCITEAIVSGEKIKLINFGNFEVVRRAARKGHNPYYNKFVDIPACNEPVFRPGLELKQIINNADIDL